MKNYGENIAVKSWTGPADYTKDFSIQSRWYEIKTTSSNSNDITISSLGQLDSDEEGCLVIIRVEVMSSEYSNKPSSLNDIVLDILSKIECDELKDILLDKLLSKGYSPYNENDEYKFRFISMDKYKVNDCFPRICKKDIKYAEIDNVKYDLHIASLEMFKIK